MPDADSSRIGRRHALFALSTLSLGCTRTPTNSELWFGGDVHLAASRPALAADLSALLAGAAGVVNLEGPVAPPLAERADRVVLHNAPEVVSALGSELGISLVGIANNHRTDAGAGGPEATTTSLRALGLLPVGDVAGLALQAGLAFVAAMVGDDLSDFERSLRAARSGSDQVCVLLHSVGPPSYLPDNETRRYAELAVDLGARLVVVCGSHQLGPLERRPNALIAWGLGNLFFSCDCTREVDALLLRVRLEDAELRAQVIPIQAGLHGAPAELAKNAPLLFELLDALGSSPLRIEGKTAWL